VDLEGEVHGALSLSEIGPKSAVEKSNVGKPFICDETHSQCRAVRVARLVTRCWDFDASARAWASRPGAYVSTAWGRGDGGPQDRTRCDVPMPGAHGQSYDGLVVMIAPLALLPDWDPTVTAAVVGLVAGLIGALIAEPLRVWAERHLLGHRLRREYEHEQRRKLQELTARYHGRLVDSAAHLNYRFWNLYRNEERGFLRDQKWLDDPAGYYFRTTAFRFLLVCSLARAFERDGYFIDSRFSQEERDLYLLKFAKAFLWVTTDVALFRGLDYDESRSFDQLLLRSASRSRRPLLPIA
jgi:hypothetical protein